VTTTQGVDAFMFTEKEYPLKAGTYGIMVASGIRANANAPPEKLNQLIESIQMQSDRAVWAMRSKTLCLEAPSQ
jgi:hypothetical protein